MYTAHQKPLSPSYRIKSLDSLSPKDFLIAGLLKRSPCAQQDIIPKLFLDKITYKSWKTPLLVACVTLLIVPLSLLIASRIRWCDVEIWAQSVDVEMEAARFEAHLYLCICVDVFYTCICTMRSRCWLWDGSRESGRWELVWKLQICSSSCHFFALLLDLWKVRCKSNANTKSHRNSRHFTEKVK